MKKLALTLSLLAAVTLSSGAQAMIVSGVDSSQFSGAQIHQMIQQRGSVILRTGPGLFDRYVANGSHCLNHEETRAAYVPTADSNAAIVGFKCVGNSADH
jgi:hypothetical protein